MIGKKTLWTGRNVRTVAKLSILPANERYTRPAVDVYFDAVGLVKRAGCSNTTAT
jgi:hypothetical protein